jgi:hypothetical protein
VVELTPREGYEPEVVAKIREYGFDVPAARKKE